MVDRWKIVQEARSWIDTPFQHQGRMKGQAVDCLGLLVGIAKQLDLRSKDGSELAKWDCVTYGHYPDGDNLQRELSRHLQPILSYKISLGDEKADIDNIRLSAADIGLFCIDGMAQHLAVFAIAPDGYLTIIHSYAPARKVVEHRLDSYWCAKLVAAYRIYGVD